MNFAGHLKCLRIDKKLSQKTLSEEIGIPQTTLSDLENNKYEPDISLAKKIATYFNKKIDDMIE